MLRKALENQVVDGNDAPNFTFIQPQRDLMAQSVEQLYLVQAGRAPDANGTPIGTGAPPGKVHIEQGTVQEEVFRRFG